MSEKLNVAFYVLDVVHLLVTQRAESRVAELAHKLQINAKLILNYAVLYNLKAVSLIL